jgi:hypothetical protein
MDMGDNVWIANPGTIAEFARQSATWQAKTKVKWSDQDLAARSAKKRESREIAFHRPPSSLSARSRA